MDNSRQTGERELDGAAKCLGMFAKYWDVGAVKTRLGNRLGMAAAAELHRAFVTHLAARLSSVKGKHYLFVAPDSRCDDFAACAPAAWQVEPQGRGGLGERMQRFFRRCFEHSQRVVLIGSDCPTLTPVRIESAFAGLERHDVVLGPAADGGYYLIGLRSHWNGWMERLFIEMPWSSDQVAAVTRQRIREAGASWLELPPEEDIDTIDCLRRLDHRLSTELPTQPRDKDLAVAVRRALAGAGLPGAEDASKGAKPQQTRGSSS